MKKLFILFVFALFTLSMTAQKSESLWDIELVTGTPPATVVIPIGGDISLVRVFGTAAPTTDVVITASATPTYPMTFEGIYYANITNSAGVKWFGVKIPDEMLDDTVYMRATFKGTGAAWEATIHPNMGAVGCIPIKAIDDSGFDGTSIELDATNGLQIVDGGVTIAKIDGIPAGEMLMGDAGGVAVTQALTGDVLIDGVGATTLQNSTVDIANIVDEAVTVAKMADLAEGSILQGGSSDRPVALDASTSGNMLIADGTDLASVGISADININSAGVATIQADAITGNEIADAAVALAKLETITPGQLIIADGSGVPVAVTVTGDITFNATGVATISAGAILGSQVSDDLNQSNFSTTTTTYTTEGMMACYLELNLKSYMTGTSQQVFEIPIGYTVVDVIVMIGATAGLACTFDVGYYCKPTALNPVAFLDTGDANVSGIYLMNDATYNTGFNTYYTADGCGISTLSYVTIISSVDATLTPLSASMKIYYMPNH